MRRRQVGQIVAALASAVLIVGVVVGEAGANHCNGCIDKADIARNSVASPELVNGGVKAEDIDTGAVRSSDIKNGTVLTKDLAPAARTRAGQLLLGGESTNSTTPVNLWSFTVTVPNDGYVVLSAAGTWYTNADAAANTSLGTRSQLALCDASATLADANCGDLLWLWWTDDEGDSPSGLNAETAFAINRVFPVTAGQNTFYINGQQDDGFTFLVENAHVTATFARASLAMAVVV